MKPRENFNLKEGNVGWRRIKQDNSWLAQQVNLIGHNTQTRSTTRTSYNNTK